MLPPPTDHQWNSMKPTDGGEMHSVLSYVLACLYFLMCSRYKQNKDLHIKTLC